MKQNNILEQTTHEISKAITELENIEENFILAPKEACASMLKPFSNAASVRSGEISANKLYQQWLVQHVKESTDLMQTSHIDVKE